MGTFLDSGIPFIRERIFEEKYIYKPKFNEMAKFYKVSLVVFVIQMSIQFSTSMYDIYRGDIDMYSRDILIPHHIPRKCGVDYCSCDESMTFIYDIETPKGKCVKNKDIRDQSGE